VSYLSSYLIPYANHLDYWEDEAAESNLRLQRDFPADQPHLRAELEAMYCDPAFDWIGLLWSKDDEYRRYFNAQTQDEARDFVTTKIWNVLFPDMKDSPPAPDS
jgi:hypothetical protein